MENRINREKLVNKSTLKPLGRFDKKGITGED